MKRKQRLFKNDILGIKEKIFRHEVDKQLKRFAHINSELIRLSVICIDNIGIPKNNEDIQALKKYVSIYDKTISDLEKHIRYARLYLESEDN